MADVASPRANRLAVPRWLDTRVLAGILLILIAVVAGARVFASASHYDHVWVAAHDLVPGERITAADLRPARVRFADSANRYVSTATSPAGYLVTRYVAARELLPATAVAAAPRVASDRWVTVPVSAGHLPAALGPGQLVDVYLTPKSTNGAPVQPVLVLAAAAVQSRDGGTRTLGGDSTIAVVLDVPADRVAAVVHAVESGSIDLVAVPPAGAQGGP